MRECLESSNSSNQKFVCCSTQPPRLAPCPQYVLDTTAFLEMHPTLHRHKTGGGGVKHAQILPSTPSSQAWDGEFGR